MRHLRAAPRRADQVASVLLGAAYAWWATGVVPFTSLAYVAVAVPVAAVVVAYGTAGGLSPGQPGAAGHCHRAGRHPSLLATLPWLAILAAAVTLEAVALALGGRSRVVPTLSTVVDHAMVWHVTRLAVFGAWMSVGWLGFGRLARRHPSSPRHPDVVD